MVKEQVAEQPKAARQLPKPRRQRNNKNGRSSGSDSDQQQLPAPAQVAAATPMAAAVRMLTGGCYCTLNLSRC